VAANKSNTPKKMSSDLDLDSVKLLVATLCEEDQQSLLDHLALQRVVKKNTTQQERKFNLFTDSLASELGESLGQSSRLFPLPLLSQAKKMYKSVEVFMKDINMDDSNVKETKIMYNVIARTMVLHAHAVSAKAKIPVSMKLVLQTTVTIHSLLDNNFPGYIKAGLLSAIVKQHQIGYVEERDDE
jgi:hypothetical protein